MTHNNSDVKKKKRQCARFGEKKEEETKLMDSVS